jgi:8-oxo-dGTP diphosphatase
MAVERIRGKIDYAPIAFDLVPDTFTVNELRAVYEAVKGRTYDPTTFHRKFRRMVADGVIVAAPGNRITGGRRASVFRFVRLEDPS